MPESPKSPVVSLLFNPGLVIGETVTEPGTLRAKGMRVHGNNEGHVGTFIMMRTRAGVASKRPDPTENLEYSGDN